MSTSRALAEATERSPVERALGVITEVHAGEGRTALLVTLDVFLILTAYYLIKPVREALILAMPAGARYKSYLGAAIAVALLVVVPLYGRAADRFKKDKLVVGVTLFFASHLLVFFGLSATSLQASLGILFFVWVGVFNMMLVAQFWAFANDLYTEEQGKRLFALVGMGASLGAVAGSYLTKLLVKSLGTFPLMLVSAALLVASAGLSALAARSSAKDGAREPPPPPKGAGASKDDGSGTFALVFRHKYLVLVAVFAILFTLVNTNGEYMLGELASAEAKAIANGDKAAVRDYLAGFYGDLFLYVNLGVVLLQTFAVSRLVKFGGLRLAFFVLPVIALLDAIGIAASPVLGIVRAGKIAENATDYSVNNTVRNMLWLPTSQEMKYKAKQAVDTFFVRTGDVASAVLVAILAGQLGAGVRVFALLDVVLVGIWLVVARGIIREYERLGPST